MAETTPGFETIVSFCLNNGTVLGTTLIEN